MNNDQVNWQRALNQLPTHEPRPDTWPQIAQWLDTEEAVHQAKPELPTYEASADTWEHIAAHLAPACAPRTVRWWHWAAAAMLVTTLGALVWYQLPHEDAVVSYHEESLGASVAYQEEIDPLETEALAYVQQACAQQRPVCQTAEFQRLKTHLEELSEQEANLLQTMQQLGYDPQLVKYQVRIENLKADATKELIQLVM